MWLSLPEKQAKIGKLKGLRSPTKTSIYSVKRTLCHSLSKHQKLSLDFIIFFLLCLVTINTLICAIKLDRIGNLMFSARNSIEAYITSSDLIDYTLVNQWLGNLIGYTSHLSKMLQVTIITHFAYCFLFALVRLFLYYLDPNSYACLSFSFPPLSNVN